MTAPRSVTPQESRRRYHVELRCGNTLFYEWANLVPATGESVPCAVHGYCSVATTAGVERSARVRVQARARQRTSAELIEYMSRRGSASLDELRRKRFSLRLVAMAEKSGLLDVDWAGGTVRGYVSASQSSDQISMSSGETRASNV